MAAERIQAGVLQAVLGSKVPDALGSAPTCCTNGWLLHLEA
jgi:hypothetical protein